MRTILTEIDSAFASDLVGILQKDGRHPMVEPLITSQLDVDRMDYLLRDALNTGVTYGRFELARLLRSLTLVDGQILLRASALHTVEQYILARYFMYTQVYLHPVTVGSDVLVQQILLRAAELVRAGGLPDVPVELLGIIGGQDAQVSVADYLAMDESTLLYAFRTWSKCEDAVLADLSRRFLHRRLFAPVLREEPTAQEWASLRTAARAMGYHPNYYVCGRASAIAGYVYSGEGILLLKQDGARTELSRESRVVRELLPDSEYRIFVPKEMLEGEGPQCDRVRSILHYNA